jgi:hypothetical protein
MHCEIDADGAGSYADALIDGAERFCANHPNERWKIAGVLHQSAAIALSATDGSRNMVNRLLMPVLDMTNAIYEELERFRSSN